MELKKIGEWFKKLPTWGKIVVFGAIAIIIMLALVMPDEDTASDTIKDEPKAQKEESPKDKAVLTQKQAKEIETSLFNIAGGISSIVSALDLEEKGSISNDDAKTTIEGINDSIAKESKKINSQKAIENVENGTPELKQFNKNLQDYLSLAKTKPLLARHTDIQGELVKSGEVLGINITF